MSLPVINLIGDIDEDMLTSFSEALRSTDSKKIQIQLHSAGGDAHAALAIVSLMRLSKRYITVIGMGYVASAATLILAAGNKRLLTQESWVMVHEDSGEVSGSVSNLEAEVRQLRRMENQWNNLLEHYTGTKATEWDHIHLNDTYLTPQECLDLGLIDEIV